MKLKSGQELIVQKSGCDDLSDITIILIGPYRPTTNIFLTYEETAEFVNNIKDLAIKEADKLS